MTLPYERIEFELSYYNSNTFWIDIDALLRVFGLDRETLANAEEVKAAVRRVAHRMPTYVTLKDVKRRWGHGQEDVFPVAQFDQAGASIAFGAHPTFPKSSGSYQDMDPNGLAVGTKHPDESWTFIRYQAETPNWAISRGNLPARQDQVAAWQAALYGDVAAKARVNVYGASLANSAQLDPIGHLSNWRDLYTQLISPQFDKVWAGQTTVTDVLHSLKPQLQSQVAKGMPA